MRFAILPSVHFTRFTVAPGRCRACMCCNALTPRMSSLPPAVQLLCPLIPCEPKAKVTRHKAKRVYPVYGGDDFSGIRTELVGKGPIQAVFTVFEDFLHYAGGVYRHVAGRKLGLHAVKLVGYGQSAGDNGTAYWLAMNSWGPSFGNAGTFKISVGDSGTGFEENMLAGEPCLPGDRSPSCLGV